MLKKRIIPVILLKDGKIVQSRRFRRFNILGEPLPSVQRISNWKSDELIYLDISRNKGESHAQFLTKLVSEVSLRCFVPLAFGGGVQDLATASALIQNGADKITFNTAAIDSPELLLQVSESFGSQCVVASIDAVETESGYRVYTRGMISEMSPEFLAKRVEQHGAGEILINSVNRDGTSSGFDLDLIQMVCSSVNLPVIAVGGAGNWLDFQRVIEDTSASGVAAANIFQHSENSVYKCREFLFENGCNVRPPGELNLTSSSL